jgi:hypothetical protein
LTPTTADSTLPAAIDLRPALDLVGDAAAARVAEVAADDDEGMVEVDDEPVEECETERVGEAEDDRDDREVDELKALVEDAMGCGKQLTQTETGAMKLLTT